MKERRSWPCITSFFFWSLLEWAICLKFSNFPFPKNRAWPLGEMFSCKAHLKIRHSACACKNVPSVKRFVLFLRDKQSWSSRYVQSRYKEGNWGRRTHGSWFPENMAFKELRILMWSVAWTWRDAADWQGVRDSSDTGSTLVVRDGM